MAIYELLLLMYDTKNPDGTKKNVFTTRELSKLSGLCVTSVSRNLSKLVSRGYLTRADTWSAGNGRFVTYTLKRGGALDDFVKLIKD